MIHHGKNSVLYGSRYKAFVFDTQSFSAQRCCLTSIILLHACYLFRSLRSGLGFSNWSEHHRHLRVSVSVDLGWSPQICISASFPGDTNAAGLGATL